jgi:SPP1 gp7 family putative phage head morphogenesis protein
MADDEDAFRLAITESLDDAYVDMFEAGGTAARRALGVRGAFRLESPAVAEALAQRANLLAGNVADDVFERLKTVLAEEFYFAGKGPFEVARTLRGEFDWLTKARSELLARTETGAIVSEASWITYSASGVPFKRWLATLDGKEREDHFDAHGQIRAIDEPYDVGGEQLMHPLNCRCDEVPVVTADQAFSDADVWDGTNNPDQFARERLADPDRPPRQTGPDPSATDDLDFAFPEDE